MKTTKDAFLIQHQKETRYRKGQKENMLDLVFTFKEETVHGIETLAPIGKSDHNMLVINLKLNLTNETVKRPTLKYPKGNYEEMKKQLNDIKWNKELGETNTEQAWGRFKEIIEKLISENVPVSGGTGRTRKGAIWMDKETLEKVKRKHKTHREHKKAKKILENDTGENPDETKKYLRKNLKHC